MKEIILEKIIYLCKYHDIDSRIAQYIGVKTIYIEEIIDDLKRKGLYEHYKNLNEREYEKLIKQEKINNNKNAYIFKEEEEIMENNNNNNNLTKLNDVLFEQLRRLSNENLSEKELDKELAVSKQVVSVSQTIINNANLLLQARKHFDGCGAGNNKVESLPLLGEIKDD